MEVQYIMHMGSDLNVANCARVSFAKYNNEFDEAKDTKLINFLAREGHWSPFSHQYIQFRFKTPFFVRNQLYKHMIGLNVGENIGEEMAWNEVSRRYVSYEPEFFYPDIWRRKAADKKQGSLEESVEGGSEVEAKVKDFISKAEDLYNFLLEREVCPELARMILPQNSYSEWIWTGSLIAWHRICQQRLAHDTQKETRDAVALIVPHLEKLFPASWKALNEI